jgi:hypothetical protein
MLTAMRAFFLTLVVIATGCGGLATERYDAGDDSGPFGRGQDGSDGNSYISPSCPEAGPPPSEITCNVFDPNGCVGGVCCDPGQACYPVVVPPDMPCQTETYGAVCLGAGVGTQGAPCGQTDNCAGGFVCLITGATTQCAQMCDLQGTDGHGCSDGYICEPIDIPGFAACL